MHCPPNLRVSIIDSSPVLLAHDSLFHNVMTFAPPWVSPRTGWGLAKTLGIETRPNQPAPEMKAGKATPKTGMIVSVARMLLGDPDVLVVLRARWPAGGWHAQVLGGLLQWQREGLRAILGSEDDIADRSRTRTLILTEDAGDPNSVEGAETFRIETSADHLSNKEGRVAEGDVASKLVSVPQIKVDVFNGDEMVCEEQTIGIVTNSIPLAPSKSKTYERSPTRALT
eukprot:gnl/MRDRNA2_/MRDRNA2_323303_c0_seq1.p1 gnl/MRDRNA2_/MRDRNA2_323303_c0~~gnl/MRDRNA2_/MRDRNA2_323303_c0_seq1.p1  ORF type:complete len:237 (+),score=20.85 gnl/MRDRNA2_/MRDRNA2_323303_c0_seq1:31-711(+)